MLSLKEHCSSQQSDFYVIHLNVFNPGEGLLQDYGLYVSGNKIIDCAPTDEFKIKYSDKTLIDGSEFTVMPGLVNGHTHSAMGFFRGLGQGIDSMIETFLFPAEKSLTPELTEPLSWSYLVDGLKSGVTTFVDHYYYINGVGQGIDRLGMRGVIGETVADLGGAFPDQGAIDRQTKLLSHWNFSSRIKPCLAPHAADTVSESLFTKLVEISKTDNLLMHFHLSQTKGERDRVMKRTNKTPVRYAHELGALTENTLAVHLVTADQDDLDILADTGVSVGFCPISQVIYETIAPVEKFIEKKIPLVIGTDCAASNDSADVLQELKFASLLYMERSKPKSTLSASQVFDMAIGNSCKLLFPELKLGKIKPDYIADLVFIKDSVELLPWDQQGLNLLFSSASRNVKHVMIDGKWVLWDTNLVNVDEKDLRSAYQGAVKEIKSRVERS